MSTLLLILPYAGLVLSTVAVIWGLTHDLYTKAEDGKRLLTRAGKYSIAYTVLGLLISFNTAVLKTITDNNARSEAAQKEQKMALDNLTEKQLAEFRHRELSDEARKTEAQIAEGNQKQRDDAMAAQQRDLSLKQQQLAGFNQAELRAKQRTLEELQSQHKILFNINRSQYLIGDSTRLLLSERISTNHPFLKKYATQIQERAQQILDTMQNKTESDKNLGSVDVDRNSPLIPPEDRMEFFFGETHLHFYIVSGNKRVDSKFNFMFDSDIEFDYPARVFGSKGRTGFLSYWTSDRSYHILTPHPIETTTDSNGNLVSYLDLPGTTLLIRCMSRFGNGCDYTTVDWLMILTPLGNKIMIKRPSFDHVKIFDPSRGDEDFIIHRFSPDVDSFFDRYKF